MLKRSTRLFTLMLTLAAMALIATAPSPALAAATQLFGTTANATGTSDLVELDPDTGVLIQNIGPVGYLVNGLSYDPVSATLYASTSTYDRTFPSGLLKIDLDTAKATPVGKGFGDGLVGNIRAGHNGDLYAWTETSDDLVAIDPLAGTASVVGDSLVVSWDTGLSFNQAGILYLVNGNRKIYTIDPYTGASTDTGKVVAAEVHLGDFHPDSDDFYGIDKTGAGPKNLKVIEITTGAVEQTLPTVANLDTIAFVKPLLCPVGQVQTNLFFDDMENGLANWGVNSWWMQTGYPASGEYALYGPDYGWNTDIAAWMSTPVTLPPGANLDFMHAFGFEGWWDSGRVEYSTDGGASWADAGSLFVQNGYNSGASWGFGGAAFSSGSGGYIESRLDLSSLAGQEVQFRFHTITDYSVGSAGWYVDDVNIYSCAAPAVVPTAGNLTSLDANPRYPLSTDYVNLRWGGVTTPGVNYELERSVNGGTFTKIYTGTMTTARYRAASLPRGQNVFRARAVKNGYRPGAWRTSQPIMVR
jgi:hypothetical protein